MELPLDIWSFLTIVSVILGFLAFIIEVKTPIGVSLRFILLVAAIFFGSCWLSVKTGFPFHFLPAESEDGGGNTVNVGGDNSGVVIGGDNNGVIINGDYIVNPDEDEGASSSAVPTTPETPPTSEPLSDSSPPSQKPPPESARPTAPAADAPSDPPANPPTDQPDKSLEVLLNAVCDNDANYDDYYIEVRPWSGGSAYIAAYGNELPQTLHLKAGTYDIKVYDDSHSSNALFQSSIDISDHTFNDITIHFYRDSPAPSPTTADIKISAYCTNGWPDSDFTLYLSMPDGSFDRLGPADRGPYSRTLDPGTYTLEVDENSIADFYSFDFTVSHDDLGTIMEVEVPFSYAPPADTADVELSAYCTNGWPDSDFTLYLYMPDGSFDWLGPADKGPYLRTLDPGTYTLEIDENGFTKFYSSDFTVSDDDLGTTMEVEVPFSYDPPADTADVKLNLYCDNGWSDSEFTLYFNAPDGSYEWLGTADNSPYYLTLGSGTYTLDIEHMSGDPLDSVTFWIEDSNLGHTVRFDIPFYYDPE